MTNLLCHSFLRASQRHSARALSLVRKWSRAGTAAIRSRLPPFLRRWTKFELEDEISLVLLAYFIILFGLLLLVHFLQPERGPTTGSSRSPMHQQERPAN